MSINGWGGGGGGKRIVCYCCASKRSCKDLPGFCRLARSRILKDFEDLGKMKTQIKIAKIVNLGIMYSERSKTNNLSRLC